jgi:hypothetical protein
MGSIAFLLDLLVELLINGRWYVTELVVRGTGTPILGLLVILAFSLIFVLIAAIITAYGSP